MVSEDRNVGLTEVDIDLDVNVPSFFATNDGQTYHDSHKGISADCIYDTRALAELAGLRPCKVCKP